MDAFRLKWIGLDDYRGSPEFIDPGCGCCGFNQAVSAEELDEFIADLKAAANAAEELRKTL